MPLKKKTGKDRQDKFYHLSKETGFRSRAAFKLIQLNRKYDFLSNANVLVDLCAAPGGWLQVAEKYMPMSSIKIGVDLDPIKPIPGCKSFICDITTPKCPALIKREIKGMQVDVVLNDGAPNVGANWSKDAYTQVELVLHSLKLATEVLRRGGWFVTKVFRSTDYQSLIWTFSKFFEKVQATKPEASRNQSAEIFVVCQNYKAPEFIDEKFFDVKYVFKDTQNTIAQDLQGQINSVDKLMQKRRNRQGYADDAKQSLYQKMNFDDFLVCENPYVIFAEYNAIEFTEEHKEKYGAMVKIPDFFEENIKDLKVLGKRDVVGIIKYRNRVSMTIRKSNRPEKKEESEDEGTDEELDSKINQTMHKDLKHIKKEKERLLVKVSKQQVSGLNDDTNFADNTEQELFSLNAHKNLNKIGYIDIEGDEEYERQKWREENPLPLRNRHTYKKRDDDEMEKNIEYLYDRKQKRKEVSKQIEKDALAKKAARKNKDIYQNAPEMNVELNPMDIEEKEEQQVPQDDNIKELNSNQFKDVMTNKMFDNDLYADLLQEQPFQIQNPMKKKARKQQQTYKSDDEEEEVVEPKKKKFSKKKDSDEWSNDDKYKIEKPLSDMEKRRKVLAYSRKKKEGKEQKKDKIEFVKEDQMEMEDYDPEDLATNLVLAKKMLRKRNEETILNSTYNKFAYNSDDENLPEWFIEDEKRHKFICLPITKEEVEEQKTALYMDQNRDSKKVLEAKWRKKQKLTRKMKKVRQKSEAIFDQEGVQEHQKIRQVQSMVKRAISKKDTKKEYVVSRGFKATNAGKNSRTHKLVDSRMRKDARGQKRAVQKTMGKRKAKRMFRKKEDKK